MRDDKITSKGRPCTDRENWQFDQLPFGQEAEINIVLRKIDLVLSKELTYIHFEVGK
jgi:hypothetical protein